MTDSKEPGRVPRAAATAVRQVLRAAGARVARAAAQAGEPEGPGGAGETGRPGAAGGPAVISHEVPFEVHVAQALSIVRDGGTTRAGRAGRAATVDLAGVLPELQVLRLPDDDGVLARPGGRGRDGLDRGEGGRGERGRSEPGGAGSGFVPGPRLRTVDLSGARPRTAGR